MTTAQTDLKRAYLFLDLGEWDDALDACDKAANAAVDHWLPPTLKGAILSAKGELKEAIKVLRLVARRHRDRALPQIYLAEALFLSGASAQAVRNLSASREGEDAYEFTELIELLHTTFIDDPA